MSVTPFTATNLATPDTPGGGDTSLFPNTSKQWAQVDDAGLVTVFNGQNPVASSLTASPTGTTNTSGLMQGLAGAITPLYTGRVHITICGVVAQSTTADGGFWHVRTGTGAPPANAGALTGTQSGCQQSMTFLTGVLKCPFSLTTIVTGLTLGTAIWIDLVLGAVTAGTITMTQVQITAIEI